MLREGEPGWRKRRIQNLPRGALENTACDNSQAGVPFKSFDDFPDGVGSRMGVVIQNHDILPLRDPEAFIPSPNTNIMRERYQPDGWMTFPNSFQSSVLRSVIDNDDLPMGIG
jgi:hypothetical protein